MTEDNDTLHASVKVGLHARTTIYDPMLFGGFLEHFGRQIYGGVFEPGSPLSDDQGFRQDVIEALRELKVPIVRWPGGCYVSGYHWEDGVGRVRTPTDDMAWGVIEPHTFGTDEFVELCRQLNCDVYICNNAGNGTIEEMKHWVEYCNASEGPYAQMRQDAGHDAPHKVAYWSIGNENWGQHEIGYKPIEEWAPLVRNAAIQMKAADPGILVSAAALPTKAWTLPMLEQAGEYLDYISIHNYYLKLWQDNTTPDYMSSIMQSDQPEVYIRDAIEALDEAGYRGRIKIAFDEWNLRGWHHPGFPRKEVQDYDDPEVQALVAAREKNLIPEQYTMADALFTAAFFNTCLRHADDIGMANIAPLVNTRGPLFVHPAGIVRRTHFHAFAMYANLLGSRVVEAKLESEPLIHGDRSIPVVDAIVTQDEAGTSWSIALVNRHPENSASCRIDIENNVLEGAFEATRLSGMSPESYNSIEHPDAVVPDRIQMEFKNGITGLPPHSLTIVKLSLPTRSEK